MEIASSLDWANVSAKLRENASAVGSDPKFNKMLKHLDELVRVISNLEVEIRRTKKIPSNYYSLVSKVNEEIAEVEMILMLAALYK